MAGKIFRSLGSGMVAVGRGVGATAQAINNYSEESKQKALLKMDMEEKILERKVRIARLQKSIRDAQSKPNRSGSNNAGVDIDIF